MKVAFLSFYSGEIQRGVETYVHELANHLVAKGIEVVVFQNGPKIKNSNYHTISIDIKIDWKKESGGKKFISYWSWIIKDFTHAVLEQMPSDVDIVIPTNGEWQSVLTKIWCITNKKKMIISGQSGVGLDERINLYTFPDYFVSLTKYQLSRSKSRNSYIKHMVIPNGVDTKSFASSKVMKVNLPKPIVMTASALVPMKRIGLVIQAVAKTNASLLIVGQGEEEGYLRRLCEEKLPNRYKIISLQHHEIAGAYKAADLFTFATSPWESFGIVLIEAMASGLGIVATDDPIRKEIIADAGIFVNPEETDQYAKGIKEALGIDWKTKAIKRAEQFSWDIIAQKYVELFNNIV